MDWVKLNRSASLLVALFAVSLHVLSTPDHMTLGAEMVGNRALAMSGLLLPWLICVWFYRRIGGHGRRGLGKIVLGIGWVGLLFFLVQIYLTAPA